LLEQQLATAELHRNDLPPNILEPRRAVARDSLASQQASES
jgi:hypothetical protein